VQVCGPLVGVIRFTLGGSSKRLFDFTRAFAKVCRKNYAAQGTRLSQVAPASAHDNSLWTYVAQSPPYVPPKALHSGYTRVTRHVPSAKTQQQQLIRFLPEHGSGGLCRRAASGDVGLLLGHMGIPIQQMTVHEAPASAWENGRIPGVPTVGWFVRRSALWIGIVAIAVILACGLYAVVSNAGTSHSRASAKILATPIKT
jgi:hypothetical protein